MFDHTAAIIVSTSRKTSTFYSLYNTGCVIKTLGVDLQTFLFFPPASLPTRALNGSTNACICVSSILTNTCLDEWSHRLKDCLTLGVTLALIESAVYPSKYSQSILRLFLLTQM